MKLYRIYNNVLARFELDNILKNDGTTLEIEGSLAGVLPVVAIVNPVSTGKGFQAQFNSGNSFFGSGYYSDSICFLAENSSGAFFRGELFDGTVDFEAKPGGYVMSKGRFYADCQYTDLISPFEARLPSGAVQPYLVFGADFVVDSDGGFYSSHNCEIDDGSLEIGFSTRTPDRQYVLRATSNDGSASDYYQGMYYGLDLRSGPADTHPTFRGYVARIQGGYNSGVDLNDPTTRNGHSGIIHATGKADIGYSFYSAAQNSSVGGTRVMVVGATPDAGNHTSIAAIQSQTSAPFLHCVHGNPLYSTTTSYFTVNWDGSAISKGDVSAQRNLIAGESEIVGNGASYKEKTWFYNEVYNNSGAVEDVEIWLQGLSDNRWEIPTDSSVRFVLNIEFGRELIPTVGWGNAEIKGRITNNSMGIDFSTTLVEFYEPGGTMTAPTVDYVDIGGTFYLRLQIGVPNGYRERISAQIELNVFKMV